MMYGLEMVEEKKKKKIICLLFIFFYIHVYLEVFFTAL